MNVETRTGKTHRLILDPGIKFGKWTILKEDLDRSGKGSGIFYFAQCECGNIKSQTARSFTQGNTTRCRACRDNPMKRHCYSLTSIHSIWKAMHQRCVNPNSKAFDNYGGRGIKVCARWKVFENFLEDMGERPVGLQLDRIDNNGNYEPGNCRWVTPKENCHNRRN